MDETTTPPGDEQAPERDIGADMIKVREHIGKIRDIVQQLQHDAPWLPMVVAVTPAPGQFVWMRCGDDLHQLGLLEWVKAAILYPQVSEATQPRIVKPQDLPAGVIPFHRGG